MKNYLSFSKPFSLKFLTRTHLLVFLTLLISVMACNKDPHLPVEYNVPRPNTNGVPPLHGMLDRSKIVMKSAIQVDLNRDVARIPLYKGYVGHNVVWYVRTDVSDEALAAKLGLNFAPRLINADKDCPTCIQSVTSSDTIPGNAAVYFAASVNFSPVRQLVPSAAGFPPLSVKPGSVAGDGYSDLIRVHGSNVVYNAPIVAIGNGAFDVSQSHTNTMDRVVAVDTTNMTVDLQFVRAFAFGKDIFYFSFSATDPVSAAIERGTYAPGMASIPAPDEDDNPQTARSEIIAFANGKTGLNNPNAQGLNHAIFDNAPGEFSNSNPALFETFRELGDARNILGSFTTVKDKAQRELYTPLWDLNIAQWSDAVVAAGINFAQTDASTVRQLASHNRVTNPDGTPLSSSGTIVNCPILGFATTPPKEDEAPEVK